MFSLNFDICMVHFHGIVTEITVFKLSLNFRKRRQLAEKALLSIKSNMNNRYDLFAIIVSMKCR